MCKEIPYGLGQQLAQGFQASKKFTFLLRLWQQPVLKHFIEHFEIIALVAFFDGSVYSYLVINWGFLQILTSIHTFVLFRCIYYWLWPKSQLHLLKVFIQMLLRLARLDIWTLGLLCSFESQHILIKPGSQGPQLSRCFFEGKPIGLLLLQL